MSPLNTILLISAMGLASGLLITLQETLFSRLINQEWYGWVLVLRKLLFSMLSMGVLFGLGGWIVSVDSLPFYQPPEETLVFFAKIGLLVSFITPISGQLNRYFSSRQQAGKS